MRKLIKDPYVIYYPYPKGEHKGAAGPKYICEFLKYLCTFIYIPNFDPMLYVYCLIKRIAFSKVENHYLNYDVHEKS